MRRRRLRGSRRIGIHILETVLRMALVDARESDGILLGMLEIGLIETRWSSSHCCMLRTELRIQLVVRRGWRNSDLLRRMRGKLRRRCWLRIIQNETSEVILKSIPRILWIE